jgi:hypothetical protein
LSTATNDEALLQSLPYAAGAEYNAYGSQDEVFCHQGTREALLQEIMEWATAQVPDAADKDSANDSRNCVFWLDGMAGTGKSTVARTVAQCCADENLLVASFFFSRGSGDLASARKFATTVAVQMAMRMPALKPFICRAVRAALPSISATSLQDQWARLVLGPLEDLRGPRRRLFRPRMRRPVVVVVDALDKCDSDSETAAILGLLSSGARTHGSLLRVFLTSRLETQIRYGMQCIPKSVQVHFVLHHIDPTTVNNDIKIFVGDSLRRIGREFVFGHDWPGAEMVNALVKQAGGLFIWAATACRLIHKGKAFAKDVLEDLLRGNSLEMGLDRNLDQVYHMVLQRAIAGDYSEERTSELISLYNDIIGTLVVLAAALDVISLARVAAQPVTAVDVALHGLHSILDISANPQHPIQLHHATFREFILNPVRYTDPRFVVDGEKQHQSLAMSCIRLMSEHLRQDICQLRDPGRVAGCRTWACGPAAFPGNPLRLLLLGPSSWQRSLPVDRF